MCGIVGYVGPREALTVLLPALRRLEYRGYDSAGVATVHGGTLEVRKAVGKIARLEAVLQKDPPRGAVGIAHTRWATHGRPSDANAHPHTDCTTSLAIVHNGIIGNYRELRQALAREGHRFHSQTDTEVIAHLIERHRENGLPEAMRRAYRGDLGGDQAERSGYMTFFRQPDAQDRLLENDAAAFRLLFAASGMPEGRERPYIDALGTQEALGAALNWYRAASVADAEGLGPIVTPTLYVWSTDDLALGAEAAEATAPCVKGPYRFAVIEGVSHWIAEQAPDRLNRLLLDHISSFGAVSAVL